MAHPFNKYLGWVQRFFHAVETGDLPPLIGTLSIDQDWPLDPRVEAADVLLIAGATQTTFFQMDNESHALVVGAWLNYVPPGVPAAGDEFSAAWVNAVGQSQRIARWVLPAGGSQDFALVGGVRHDAVAGPQNGGPPVYIPPGGFLSITTSSVAGGPTIRMRLTGIVRPKYYPLRLP